MTILAVVCVAATLGTFSVAVFWRYRVWREGRNGLRRRQGNFNVRVEALRLAKQCVLVHCAVAAISERVLLDVCVISALMAATSAYSIYHNVKLIRQLD